MIGAYLFLGGYIVLCVLLGYMATRLGPGPCYEHDRGDNSGEAGK